MKIFPGVVGRQAGSRRLVLTTEQEAWLRKWYPVTENARLAKAMGVYHDRVRIFAREYGLEKSEEGMKAIRARQAKRAAKTNEKNGCYDRKRGRPVSAATLEGLRRRWQKIHAGELDSPIVHLRKTDRKRYEDLLRRKSEERKETIRKEKMRVVYGLGRKTKLKPVVLCKYTRSQTHRRCSALKRGYLLDYDCSEGSPGRYTIYYDEETQRSPKFEENCIKDGFEIKEAI
jgi:hypothetical protein